MSVSESPTKYQTLLQHASHILPTLKEHELEDFIRSRETFSFHPQLFAYQENSYNCHLLEWSDGAYKESMPSERFEIKTAVMIPSRNELLFTQSGLKVHGDPELIQRLDRATPSGIGSSIILYSFENSQHQTLLHRNYDEFREELLIIPSGNGFHLILLTQQDIILLDYDRKGKTLLTLPFHFNLGGIQVMGV